VVRFESGPDLARQPRQSLFGQAPNRQADYKGNRPSPNQANLRPSIQEAQTLHHEFNSKKQKSFNHPSHLSKSEPRVRRGRGAASRHARDQAKHFEEVVAPHETRGLLLIVN
jgi:hypothetical protein